MCDILVLEDDAQVRSLVADVLSDLGLVVREASSVEEAEAILAEVSTEPVLLVDHDLGARHEDNGFDFARGRLAAIPNGRAIYMTANREHYGSRKPSMHERFLAKPFRLDELIGSVQEMLTAFG